MRKRKLVPLLCGLLVLTACKGRPAEPSLSPKPSEGMVQPTATAVGSPCLEESAPPTESPVSTVVPSSGPTPAPAATREPLPAPWGDTPPETEGERRMAYFRAVMERFYGDGLFPDGTPVDFSDEPLSQNRFAVHDVDGDGREELIVSIITAPQPARTALVYDYTDKKGLVLELKATSQLSFYDGVVQAGWPVDLTSGAGVLWPYTLYKYDREEDIYAEAGSAQARTEALEGVKFPKEADRDGDGVVYCLNMDYEHPVDGAAYAAWRDGLVQGEERKLSYLPWAEEEIEDIENLLTLEKAKDLIEKANAALAPFLGEGAVPCEKEGWLLFEGYASQEELLEGLKEPIEGNLADDFYRCYASQILCEEDGKVYIHSNSRDILGHYYNMDLVTLTSARSPGDFGHDWTFYSAEGSGNDNEVVWTFGFEEKEGQWRICHYACQGPYSRMSVKLNQVLYGLDSTGSPVWYGTPERIEREETQWPQGHREVYPGLEIDIWDYDEDGMDEQPVRIIVTAPGIPTAEGVEVGDTLKEVLAVYPQFRLGYVDQTARVVCPFYWNYGDTMSFDFDENLILERIYILYNISN